MDVFAFATAAALGCDLVDEWRDRQALGALVVAWPLHRVYAVPPALRALEVAGIPARVRGLRYRQIMHFWGAAVPVEILVPPARLDEARVVLGASSVSATGDASVTPVPSPPPVSDPASRPARVGSSRVE